MKRVDKKIFFGLIVFLIVSQMLVVCVYAENPSVTNLQMKQLVQKEFSTERFSLDSERQTPYSNIQNDVLSHVIIKDRFTKNPRDINGKSMGIFPCSLNDMPPAPATHEGTHSINDYLTINYGRGKYEYFYLGNDEAAKIKILPGISKKQIAEQIPTELQSLRIYKVYMLDVPSHQFPRDLDGYAYNPLPVQGVENDPKLDPFYILDEATAFKNGGQAGLYAFKKDSSETNRRELGYQVASLDFAIYSAVLGKVVKEKTPNYWNSEDGKQLRGFLKYNMENGMKIFNEAFPNMKLSRELSQEYAKMLDNLRNSNDQKIQDIRKFLIDTYGSEWTQDTFGFGQPSGSKAINSPIQNPVSASSTTLKSETVQPKPIRIFDPTGSVWSGGESCKGEDKKNPLPTLPVLPTPGPQLKPPVKPTPNKDVKEIEDNLRGASLFLFIKSRSESGTAFILGKYKKKTDGKYYYVIATAGHCIGCEKEFEVSGPATNDKPVSAYAVKSLNNCEACQAPSTAKGGITPSTSDQKIVDPEMLDMAILEVPASSFIENPQKIIVPQSYDIPVGQEIMVGGYGGSGKIPSFSFKQSTDEKGNVIANSRNLKVSGSKPNYFISKPPTLIAGDSGAAVVNRHNGELAGVAVAFGSEFSVYISREVLINDLAKKIYDKDALKQIFGWETINEVYNPRHNYYYFKLNCVNKNNKGVLSFKIAQESAPTSENSKFSFDSGEVKVALISPDTVNFKESPDTSEPKEATITITLGDPCPYNEKNLNIKFVRTFTLSGGSLLTRNYILPIKITKENLQNNENNVCLGFDIYDKTKIDTTNRAAGLLEKCYPDRVCMEFGKGNAVCIKGK